MRTPLLGLALVWSDAARALDYYAGRGTIGMKLERAGTLFQTHFNVR